MLLSHRYNNLEIAYSSLKTQIYRAERKEDGAKVIMKVSTGDHHGLQKVEILKHEYMILKGLEGAGIPRVVGLEEDGSHVALVLKESGHKNVDTQNVDMELFFNLAMGLTLAIQSIHNQGVLHRDIKPSNSVYNPDDKSVLLIDFGTAIHANDESLPMEGTLAYMSPEQTGKMSHKVDWRSDLYSLGITLYEWLTGRLPFEAEDALGWIRCHMSIEPAPVLSYRQDAGKTLAAIIHRLIQKEPNKRYQSASGLLYDLQQCKKSFEEMGVISDFELGTQDFPPVLEILSKSALLERQEELDILLQNTKKPGITLLHGERGLGKGELLREMGRLHQNEDDFFYEFKCIAPTPDQHHEVCQLADMFQQHIEAQLIQDPGALSWLDQTFLEEYPEILLQIPELQDIYPSIAIDEFTGATSLSAYTTEMLFHKLLHHTPVVLSIRDAEHLDSDTSAILNRALTRSNVDYQLHVIYASGNMSDLHAAHEELFTQCAQDEHLLFETVTLKHLSKEGIHTLVSQAIHGADNLDEITDVIYHRIGGNPYLCALFLDAAVQDKIIYKEYENQEISWRWSVPLLESMPLPEVIKELVWSSFKGLSKEQQDVFFIASCMLGMVERKWLDSSTKTDVDDVLLWATQHRLFEFHEAEQGYTFTQDWFLQRCRSGMPLETHTVYYFIWSELIANLSEASPKDELLRLCYYYAKAYPLISEYEEHIIMAAHMMRAILILNEDGEHSRVAGYAQLLQDGGFFSSSEDTTCNIHEVFLAVADSYYHQGEVKTAEEFLERVDIELIEDKVGFHRLYMLVYSLEARYSESVQSALQAIQLMGFEAPSSDTMQGAIQQLMGYLVTYVKTHTLDKLHTLPEAESTEHLRVFDVLLNAAPAAYQVNPALFAWFELKVFELSTKWGIVPEGVQCFGACGMLAHGLLNDNDLAVGLGLVGDRLTQRFPDRPEHGSVHFVNGSCLFHLRYPPEEVLEKLNYAWDVTRRYNDNEYGSYAAHHLVMMNRIVGKSYVDVRKQLDASIEYCESINSQGSLGMIRYYEASLKHLQGEISLEEALETFDVLRNKHLNASGMPDTNTCISYAETAYLHYWRGEYGLAWRNIQKAKPLFPFIRGLITEYYAWIYTALSALGYLNHGAKEELSSEEFDELQELLAQSMAMLQDVAENNPKMYGAVYAIACAEQARLEGKDLETIIDLYGQAVEFAGNKFLQWRALAMERHADLWEKKRQNKLLIPLVKESDILYQRLGSASRIEKLKTRYPSILVQVQMAGHQTYRATYQTAHVTSHATNHVTRHSSGTTRSSSLQALNMDTIIKATRAIASEVQPEKLFAVLLDTMLENIGADYGALVMKRAESLWLVGRCKANEETDVSSEMLSTSSPLAQSVVRYAARHKRMVLLGDAGTDKRFKRDPWIVEHQTKSVLALPILERNELIGVLYAENNLLAQAFSPQHLEVLSVISSQAAISMRNISIFQNLESIVKERTEKIELQNKEIEVLFDRLPVGVVTIDSSLTIESRYSSQAPALFCSNELTGKTLEETLFKNATLSPEDISKTRAALEFSFGMPEWMVEMNWIHLVQAFERVDEDGNSQHLVVSWSPLLNSNDDVERVMLTVHDETALKQVEEASKKHAQELEVVGQLLAAGLRDFQEFSFNARQRINDNMLMIDAELLGEDDILELLFRNLHTIKGNARLLGLSHISESVHIAEEPIHQLRALPASERYPELLEGVEEELAEKVMTSFKLIEYHEQLLEQYLGDLNTSNAAVDSHVLNSIKAELQHAEQDNSYAMNAIEAIHVLLSSTEAVSLEHLTKKTSRMFPSMADELEKLEPAVLVTGDPVWFSFGFASIFNDAMIHLFRNSLDHGIERPQERESLGKPEQGTITLNATATPEGISLELYDDGAGLDLERLRGSRPERQNLSDEETAELIFASGVSTAKAVSNISGRGVGMDAVRVFLEQRKCSIHIELLKENAQPTRKGTPFKFVIFIPKQELVQIH